MAWINRFYKQVRNVVKTAVSAVYGGTKHEKYNVAVPQEIVGQPLDAHLPREAKKTLYGDYGPSQRPALSQPITSEEYKVLDDRTREDIASFVKDAFVRRFMSSEYDAITQGVSLKEISQIGLLPEMRNGLASALANDLSWQFGNYDRKISTQLARQIILGTEYKEFATRAKDYAEGEMKIVKEQSRNEYLNGKLTPEEMFAMRDENKKKILRRIVGHSQKGMYTEQRYVKDRTLEPIIREAEVQGRLNYNEYDVDLDDYFERVTRPPQQRVAKARTRSYQPLDAVLV